MDTSDCLDFTQWHDKHWLLIKYEGRLLDTDLASVQVGAPTEGHVSVNIALPFLFAETFEGKECSAHNAGGKITCSKIGGVFELSYVSNGQVPASWTAKEQAALRRRTPSQQLIGRANESRSPT